MDLLGKISVYFESKGFGFIKSKFSNSGEKGSDVFFHIKDCIFKSLDIDDWVLYELKEYNGKVKAVNVRKIILIEEIDYLSNNWKYYSFGLKKKVKDELEDYLGHYISTYIDYSEYNRRFGELLKSDARRKIIEVAKSFIANNEHSNNEDLYNFFASILERVLIGEFLFVRDCKRIIDETINKEFYSKYAVSDVGLSKVLSRTELCSMVSSYLQNQKPSIMYTHTYEDGYWATRWKWDGSEDYWVNSKSSSDIECSQNQNFSFGDISFPWRYWGYNEDIHSKEDVFLEVYSFLRNSRKFWETLVNVFRRKEYELLQNFIDRICKSVFTEILQYFVTMFPIYGKVMCNFSQDWKEKYSFYITNYDIEGFLSRGISLSERLERIFAGIDKCKQCNKLNIKGVNILGLEKHLLDVSLYLYQSVANMIEDRYVPCKKFSAFDYETINKDGMLLSCDEKVLYAITDQEKQEIIVPSSVTHVGDGAFVGCNQLKTVQFLGSIIYIGHDVLRGIQPEICGDFSQLSFMGYNTSCSNMTINGEMKKIKEWSLFYNKKDFEETDIIMKEIHIKHDDD